MFAAWLLEYLKARQVQMAIIRRAQDGSDNAVRTSIAYDSFKLNRICEDCNNGWMSDLEQQAKPVIIDLISGKTKLEALDAKEREVLARWAGKTAIIESHAVGAESPIDCKVLQWMRRHPDATPGRFAVVARSMRYDAVGHLQAAPITKLADGRSTAVGNGVVLALPKLILVCGFPDPDIGYDCLCDLSVCHPIWPDPAHWQQMKGLPDSRMPEGDWVEIMFVLVERIELKYRLGD